MISTIRDPFPDPQDTPQDGVVGFGLDLSPEILMFAYRKGIFPWPMGDLGEGEEAIPWFCPAQRAILEYERLHISKSLRSTLKKSPFKITIDRAFKEVIQACAAMPRPGQDGTWISSEMIKAYAILHEKGIAHSVEVWSGTELVGGLYGVDAGGVFSGESMFHQVSNASKMGLLYLLEYLKERGLDWIDIQMMTPHLEALGAREIPRAKFLEKLKAGLGKNAKIF